MYCTCKFQNNVLFTFIYQMFSSLSPSSHLHFYMYLSLVCSQLCYCFQLWRPRLLKDIICLELIQCRATKFILCDSFGTTNPGFIPLIFCLMHWLELFLILCSLSNIFRTPRTTTWTFLHLF